MNFHNKTVHSFVEMLVAAGIENANMLNRSHMFRRVSIDKTERYDEIYPLPETGCLLNKDTIPENYKLIMSDDNY